MTDPERPRTTPEGHTPEEPKPTELGRAGTPGAGMTPDVPHAADARAVEQGEPRPADEPVGEAHAAAADDPPAEELVAHRAADSHMDAHTSVSDDDHAHAEPRLGPIDWPMWGYAVAGIAIALAIVLLFMWAIRPPA